MGFSFPEPEFDSPYRYHHVINKISSRNGGDFSFLTLLRKVYNKERTNILIMSTFLSLFSFSHIWKELSRTIRRFPLSSVFIVIVTMILLYLTHESYTLDDEVSQILTRIVITSVISFFLSTAMVLALEQSSLKSWKRVVFYSFVLVFAGVFYLALDKEPFDSTEGATMVFLTFFGFFAFLFFSPFLWLWRGYRELGYVRYFYAMATILLMSGVIWWAVMALGSIAIASIDALFDVTWVNSNSYTYTAVLAFCTIAPIFALARIPDRDVIGEEQGSENVFFTFLVKYVGLPFIVLYFVILYAYSLKVLMNFSDWPKWQISWMVIGFSVFGYLLYIFSYSIGEKSDLIQRVRRYFPAFVIPQVTMLFYAIYLRIAQYDLTMNRYFVVVFGLWLLGISLYYTLARSTRLVIIPASLALITLIISVGPWSVYELPLARQEARLMRDLTTAGIYRDGEIVPLASYESIDSQLSNDIYEGIGYICSYAHCYAIRSLFASQLISLYAEKQARWDSSEVKYQKCVTESSEKWGCYREEYDDEPSTWEIQSAIAEAIKVRSSPYDTSIPQVYSFWLDGSRDGIFPLDVSGYDRIVKVMGKDIWNSEKYRDIVFFDLVKWSWELKIDGDVVEIYSLDNLEKSLLSIRWDVPSWQTIYPTREQMIYTLSGVAYDMEIHLENINIPNPVYSGSNISSNYVDGYALIRKK